MLLGANPLPRQLVPPFAFDEACACRSAAWLLAWADVGVSNLGFRQLMNTMLKVSTNRNDITRKAKIWVSAIPMD